MASFLRRQRKLRSQRPGVLHFVPWQACSNLTQTKCTWTRGEISLRSACCFHEHPVNMEMKVLLVFGSEIENAPWGATKHKNKVIKIFLENKSMLCLPNNLIVFRRCFVETRTLWLCSFTRVFSVFQAVLHAELGWRYGTETFWTFHFFRSSEVTWRWSIGRRCKLQSYFYTCAGDSAAFMLLWKQL